MSFSSRDITRAIRSGCPVGSPGFAQAALDSRRQRQAESRASLGESVLRRLVRGAPEETLTGARAARRLTQQGLRFASPDCAALEIYPPLKDEAVWAVRGPRGELRFVIAVRDIAKYRLVWRE